MDNVLKKIILKKKERIQIYKKNNPINQILNNIKNVKNFINFRNEIKKRKKISYTIYGI